MPQADQQRVIVDRALSELPLSLADRQNGFWYTIKGAGGVDSIGFIDPEQLARRGLNDTQIAALMATLKRARLTSRDSMQLLDEDEMPSWARFHNDLYAFTAPGAFQSREAALEATIRSKSPTPEAFEQLAYLLELKGDYGRRDTLLSQACKTFKARCVADGALTIVGRVVDPSGLPVAGAAIAVLGKPSLSAIADSDGRYRITLKVNRPEKLRVSASKLNYSHGVVAALAAPGGPAELRVDDLILATALGHVTINTAAGTVEGSAAHVEAGGAFSVRTTRSLYRIPADAIVTSDGRPYRGIVDVYLFEFDNGTIPDSLASIDTFDQVMGYAGNLMKSFGMPYIQFFTPEGKELHVLSSKPMTLTYRIANMADLHTAKARIYAPLTDADMDRMIDASLVARDGYPIDRQWLITNDLLRFAAFWVFDRSKGVWEAIGIRVLDRDGTIEAPFYTLSKPL